MKVKFILIALFAATTLAKGEVPSLAVGGKDLKQKTISEIDVTPGMKYSKVIRGEVDEKENIAIISTILSDSDAEDAKEKLLKAGFKNINVLDLPELSPNQTKLGKIISIDFSTEDEAKEALSKIKEVYPNNFTVRNKAENGYLTSGPYNISILEVDFNKYTGNVQSSLAKGNIKELDTTTNIAKENNAIAAVNGGYFVFNEDIGTTGDLAGISVVDGVLASEARDGSPALVITSGNGKNSADILENVTTEISIKSENNVFAIDGVNRKLGLSFGGGNPDDTPTNKPVHDMLTKDSSEIVIFNSLFGDTVDIDKDEIAFKIENNKVSEMKEEGQFKLEKGTVIAKASGEKAVKIKNELKIGDTISVNEKVLSNGNEIQIGKGVYIVNGGPTLLLGGSLVNNRAAEGWDDSVDSREESLDAKDSVATGNSTDRRDFYYGWVLRRHPRTAVGVTEDNKLISVVVYGRDYKNTVGANITEMGEIMQSLGATKAINLDGGGSSMMIIKNEQTGKSSDATGERPVGDAIIFTK